jgi:hypothetical protein
MSRIKYTKELLEPIVARSKSFAEVTRELHASSRTGSQTHISRVIRKFNIDTNHFTGRRWTKNISSKDLPQHMKPKPIETYLKKGSTIKSARLLKKLIKCDMKKHICEHCSRTTWNDESIPLELHHVDHDHTNNELQNLELLCPNCHASIHKPKPKPKKERVCTVSFCPDCGKKISYGAVHCSNCYNKYRSETARKCQRTKIDWPTRDELLTRLKDTSYLALGKELGVSDNAIRKRLKNH